MSRYTLASSWNSLSTVRLTLHLRKLLRAYNPQSPRLHLKFPRNRPQCHVIHVYCRWSVAGDPLATLQRQSSDALAAIVSDHVLKAKTYP
jgi:hypothetical protein